MHSTPPAASASSLRPAHPAACGHAAAHCPAGDRCASAIPVCTPCKAGPVPLGQPCRAAARHELERCGLLAPADLCEAVRLDLRLALLHRSRRRTRHQWHHRAMQLRARGRRQQPAAGGGSAALSAVAVKQCPWDAPELLAQADGMSGGVRDIGLACLNGCCSERREQVKEDREGRTHTEDSRIAREDEQRLVE